MERKLSASASELAKLVARTSAAYVAREVGWRGAIETGLAVAAHRTSVARPARRSMTASARTGGGRARNAAAPAKKLAGKRPTGRKTSPARGDPGRRRGAAPRGDSRVRSPGGGGRRP